MWAHKLVGTRSAGRAHPVHPCTERAGSGSRSQGQRVPARAAPSPLSLPSTDGSRGAREENMPAEWKQETHALCSHSAKNWSSSSHLTVLSRRWVFISCDRWPRWLVQSENGCTQDAPVGSFQPLSAQGMVGGHRPALHALLTAGLSAPCTSVDELDMGFRTPHHTSSDSAPSHISYPICDSTNIQWNSVKCSWINHVWSHKISIPKG